MNMLDKTRLDRLISDCRVGDNDAFSELVAAYTPMLHSEIAKLAMDFDEAFSEACVALYKATLKFDLEQSDVTFGLFAQICVRRRLLDVIRRKDKSEKMISDFDVDNIAVSDGTVSRLLHEEERESFRARARELLSEYEFNVFRSWLAGHNATHIAKILGTDVKSVENAKARILKKLRGGMER